MDNRQKMNILISVDNNYVNHAIDMLFSLKMYNDSFINLYLIYNDLSDENIEKISCFLKENNMGVLIQYYFDSTNFSFPMHIDYISVVTYFRIFAPFIINENIDRLLYLDCDLICNGSILDFYNTDFEDKIIVACENMLTDENRYFKAKFNENLDLPEDNAYINAGVLLIDVCKYKNFISVESICSFIHNNCQILYFQDQDILNKLFYGKIKIADSIYNYQINAVDSGKETFDNRIIHYSEKEKPWNNDYYHPSKAIYYYLLLKYKGEIDKMKQLLEIHSNNQAKLLFDYIMNFNEEG